MSRRGIVPGVRLVADAWEVQPVSKAPTLPATPVAQSSAVTRAIAELTDEINAAPPDRAQLPEWMTTTVDQPAPNPLVRPVGRVWQAPTGRRNGRSYRRRQLRESLDGVLAIFDPARGGDRRRPWVVIDVPPGHLTHHRDQPLADRDVQDWTVLIRATGWPRTEQP